MRTSTFRILVALSVAAAAGCASTQRPVLYPNAALERAGRVQAGAAEEHQPRSHCFNR